MIKQICRAWLIVLVIVSSWSVATMAQTPEAGAELVIGYVEVEDDSRYEPIRTTERIILKAPHRPYAGAVVGIDDAAALVRVTRTALVLDRITAAPGKAAEAIAKAAKERGISLFLLDLPPDEMRSAAAVLKGTPVLAFNVSASEDALRREVCAAEIVHVVPSHAMRTDAMLQHFVSRKWRDVLLIEGSELGDAAVAAAVLRSAKKFGVRIAAHQKFKLGNDPRDRELNNPALLTAINRDYDVVIVADQGLEMARQLPFRTTRPRPVAGTTGLEPEAWHWTWDRSGGPQLNGRFQAKNGGRQMGSSDWAAWMAVKMISEALLRTGSREVAAIKEHLVKAGVEPGGGFDGGKGLAVSVRAWDQQVRQPMLLATPLAVAAIAPVEGFLHQSNRLDTLGDDAGESPCRLDQRGR
jgi:ABC transporter substrate binding protein (PQQ-dependent alcohol dehydrogenase system)